MSLSAWRNGHDVGNRSRVRVWQRKYACVCAWTALLLFHSPGPARAQSAELAAISAQIQKGNFEEAERRLHEYLLKLPHSAKANSLLGEVYIHQGRYQLAEDALQKAIANSPALLEPRLDLGEAYLAEGKLESALAAYQAAGQVAPHDVRANLALAKLYLGTGEFAKSIEA